MTEAPCSADDINCNASRKLDDVISVPGFSAALTYISVVFTLSLLCNGSICVVFYKKPQLLTVSNRFVLNLTCCELCLSLLIIPFWIASFVGRKWLLGDTWCRVQAYVLMVLLVVIQYSLLIIAVDRNYAIVSSLRYHNVFSYRLSSILVTASWLLGILISVPTLTSQEHFAYHDTQFMCGPKWQSGTYFSVFFIIFGFVLPFVVQTCCYLSIFRAALKHVKTSNRIYPAIPSSSAVHDASAIAVLESDDVVPRAYIPRSKRMECKAVKTILLLSGSYIISWIWYVTTGMTKSFRSTTSSLEDMVAICLIFLSCAINPFIYGFMNRTTRYEMSKFCSRAGHRITGRTTVHAESEDLFSSTITTNFSSSRHTSGAFIPVTRGRANSLKVSCLKHADMMTIQEVSENEDDNKNTDSVSNKLTNNEVSGSKLNLQSPKCLLLCPRDLRRMSLRRCFSNEDMLKSAEKRNSRKQVTPTNDVNSSTAHKVLLRSNSVSTEILGNWFLTDQIIYQTNQNNVPAVRNTGHFHLGNKHSLPKVDE